MGSGLLSGSWGADGGPWGTSMERALEMVGNWENKASSFLPSLDCSGVVTCNQLRKSPTCQVHGLAAWPCVSLQIVVRLSVVGRWHCVSLLCCFPHHSSSISPKPSWTCNFPIKYQHFNFHPKFCFLDESGWDVTQWILCAELFWASRPFNSRWLQNSANSDI